MKTIYVVISAFICLICCSNAPKDPIPQHETIRIRSAQLSEERVINIWLPDGYKDSDQKFDVMYMADGGTEEYFPHIANTLSKLITEKKIKPVILVGIENTERRRDLTGFTSVPEDKKIAPVVGGSDKFRSFIRQELFPEIESRYRTTSRRGILGE